MTPAEIEMIRRMLADEIAKAIKASVAPVQNEVRELAKKVRETDRSSRQSVSDLRVEREGVDHGVAMTYENLMREVTALRTVVHDSVLPRAEGAEAAAVEGALSARRVENRQNAMTDDANRLSAKATQIKDDAKRQRKATIVAVVAVVAEVIFRLVSHLLKG
jgi:hypothetical protein